MTSTTPSDSRARRVSIAPRRACACELRRNATCSMPGSARSSMNSARPLSSRGSSLRFERLPNGPGVAAVSLIVPSLLLHERHDARERRLAALESEREAAQPDALIEHLVDLPTDVLGVEDAVRAELH